MTTDPAPHDSHLAQLNIALPAEPLDSARLAAFVDRLAPVNALADVAEGFVWRLQTEDGDATAVRGFGDDRLIVNLSVWRSPAALAAFVFQGEHVAVMRRRREWFVPMREAYTVLWWVPAGHQPSVAEAEERLGHLRRHGPTRFAFSFRQPFPAPGGAPVEAQEGWLCPL